MKRWDQIRLPVFFYFEYIMILNVVGGAFINGRRDYAYINWGFV